MSDPSYTQPAPIHRPLRDGERWFVAQTIANREFRAASQLERQDFRAFLPFVMKTVRHARRTRNVRRAAFPGYVIVALDLERDRWRSVNGTIGVARLLTFGDGRPQPLPYGVVETLFGYLDDTGACRFDRDLVLGQSVRIISGPLAQAMGRLVRLDGGGRVQVLLEILGGQVCTTVERAALEAA